MKSSILSFIKFLIGWPLSLLALFFIGKLAFVNQTVIVASIEQANISLLFWGISCFVVYFFLRGYIWQQILASHGNSLSLAQVSYLWSISEIKRYIPGNIWSFLSRSLLFKKQNVSNEVLVSALFTEAQLVFLGASVLSALALPFASYLIPSLRVFSFLFPLTYVLGIFLCMVYVWSRSFTKHISTKNKPYVAAMLPKFSPAINTYHLLLSFLSFLLFGLGSYFVASSVAFLSLQHIVGFVLFFIFSFFVGYISLITPMGLGVREGVITLGLSFFIPAAMASTIALFLRILFILSELLAMGLSYFWFSNKNTFIKKSEEYMFLYRYEITLLFSIGAYITYFTTASFLRFENFFTGRFDLGNMDQTVWNSLHGRFFMFTNPDGTEVVSRFAFHADVILVLLAPFYALWRDPRMLLLLQTIVLAAGAWFVYKIALKVLKQKGLALTFGIVYLLTPTIQHTNLYDFHAVTFATTFLLAAYYFMHEKRYVWFFIFAILSGICKEQIWLIIGLFGFYIFFVQKKKLFGLSVFVIFTAITFYLVSVFIPHIRGNSHFALSNYSEFGDSPFTIVKSILISPIKVLGIILESSRIEYLKQLLLPLGFLSVFAPLFFFFASPDLLINLLSNNANFHQIYYQYSATITPFVCISAMYGTVHIKKVLYLKTNFVIVYLLLSALWGAYLYGPLPGARNPNIDMFTKYQTNRAFIAAYMKGIPRQYSVAATNNVGAHLSHRKYLFTIPTGMEKADVIVFLLGDRFAQPSPQAQMELVSKLKNNSGYILRVEKENFFVFEKRSLL